MICRLRAKYPVIDLGEFTDFDFYHLEHYHPRAALFARPHVIKNAPVDLHHNPPMHPNGEDWGLAEHQLEMSQAQIAGETASIVPEHRNDDVSAFGRLMWQLAIDTLCDRSVVYWTVQGRLWSRRWRRVMKAFTAQTAERQ